jgi:hypothetical protein
MMITRFFHHTAAAAEEGKAGGFLKEEETKESETQRLVSRAKRLKTQKRSLTSDDGTIPHLLHRQRLVPGEPLLLLLLLLVLV